ncbi:hypothetical protein KDA_42930 [Dictyobacter alpinus]|uniref:Uncharacterized protein n=1 Tax=Dictyobacter alpinus TaxID=2014873 RepID=A0A402BBU7_9CHLR|nr:hypothetical protein KDA_42930 [Dictyobacter alpinus]
MLKKLEAPDGGHTQKREGIKQDGGQKINMIHRQTLSLSNNYNYPFVPGKNMGRRVPQADRTSSGRHTRGRHAA